ncbi:hypothetical protein ATANTOWER_013482, partial [Ataeniobius toweri]|nr:hypothetical protein [Ataeniobius toweri]
TLHLPPRVPSALFLTPSLTPSLTSSHRSSTGFLEGSLCSKVDLLICCPEGPLLCSPDPQTKGLLLCSADPQTESPLLCSADLQTVSSFVAGLLHSCSATAAFLTNLQVPADAGLHGLYVSAGLLVFAFTAGCQSLYVSVSLHVSAAGR